MTTSASLNSKNAPAGDSPGTQVLATPTLNVSHRDRAMWLEVGVEQWLTVHRELKATHPRLEWLTATHLMDDTFEITSHLTSPDAHDGVVIRCTTTDGGVASLSELFATARYHESEMQILCGITFNGLSQPHPFALVSDSFPLRRDFALLPRTQRPWPGAVDPDTAARRRPSLPPGVFPEWSQ
ncbi:MAG: NADH-quinone oxidoreductase subunit C [Actinomycetes bacterium]